MKMSHSTSFFIVSVVVAAAAVDVFRYYRIFYFTSIVNYGYNIVRSIHMSINSKPTAFNIVTSFGCIFERSFGSYEFPLKLRFAKNLFLAKTKQSNDNGNRTNIRVKI